MTVDKDYSDRIALVRQEMADACRRSGRSVDEVTLMAVTKTKPPETIEALIQFGVNCFGENYPDETIGKLDVFHRYADCVRLCMIGTLQSRKAKIVAESFTEYHSIHSLRAAIVMNRALEQHERSMRVLLQLNVANEGTKHGWRAVSEPDTFLRDVEEILSLDYLTPVGLMTLPPYAVDSNENRGYFARMREMLALVNREFNVGWHELSMGTSDDFAVAIEEGATIVRVGTKLVGPRIYT